MSDPQPVTYTVAGGYITLPVDVDPNTLTADQLDAIALAFPGWVPQEGHLEVALIEAFAQMSSETAQVTAQVPIAIFSYFGNLVGILPQAGVSATVLTTWTMVDAAGYTIPAGTNVGFAVTGTDLVLFQTLADVTVAPGASTATGVSVAAIQVGVVNNGIPAGAMTLVDALAFVATVVSTAVTAGGVDPESQANYLDRLSQELQLLTPRPIVPSDFANFARQTTGVFRALAIDGLLPARTVTDGATTSGSPLVTSATGGLSTADVGRAVTGTGIPGSTTVASIPSTTVASGSSGAVLPQATVNVASAANFATAGTVLVLTTAGWQTVTYTGKTSTSFTGCTGGTGTLATGANVTTATQATLSANATATATGVSLTFGRLAGVARCCAVAAVTSTGTALSAGVKATLTAALAAKREVNFLASVIDPTFTSIDVTWSAVVTTGSDTTAVRNAVNAALTAFLNPATWGGGGLTPPQWLTTATVVRYLDLAAVIKGVAGVDHIVSLTFGAHGGSLASTDVTLTGDAPLPQTGTLTGTTS